MVRQMTKPVPRPKLTAKLPPPASSEPGKSHFAVFENDESAAGIAIVAIMVALAVMVAG